MKTVSVIVKAQLPDDVMASEFRSYVSDAVKTMIGGMDPEMPITNMNRDKIKVYHLKDEGAFTEEHFHNFEQELIMKINEEDWESVTGLEDSMVKKFIDGLAKGKVKDCVLWARKLKAILEMEHPRY